MSPDPDKRETVEKLSVNARRLSIALGLLLPAWCAGCGRPEAQFVFNERMDRLATAVRKGVVQEDNSGRPVRLKGLEETLVDAFGTPNRIVVWDKLPFDSGRVTFEMIPGWSAAVVESRQFPNSRTDFEIRIGGAGELPADPRRMTLEFHSGQFAGALVQPKGGGEPRPARFRVDSVDGDWLRVRLEEFNPDADQLVGSSGVIEVADTFPAPLPASEFVLTFPPRAISGNEIEIAVRRINSPAEEVGDDQESAGREAAAVDLPADPAGLAVSWTDGIYAGALLEQKRDGATQPARFVVAGYDRGNHLMRLKLENFNPQQQALAFEIPAEAAAESTGLPAPEPGVKFAVIGSRLQDGKKLYTHHCMHCHGVTGDGNGPTAKYLNPLPRDYRQGKFKFTSTRASERARREDLRRTILQGIPGTNMPSFLLLEDHEVESIIDYVLFLSMRGEVESKLINDIEDKGFTRDATDQDSLERIARYLEEDLAPGLEDWGESIADDWRRAEEEVALVVPGKPRTPDTPESRQRGRTLYLSATAQCADCHGVEGLGNGPQTEIYEDDPNGGKRTVRGLHDDWGHVIQPRNLTSGIYRGGRRPIDIYRRIHAGIKGAKMPAFGTALTEDQIWDLVNYVLSLPYKDSAVAAERPRTQDVAAAAGGEE